MASGPAGVALQLADRGAGRVVGIDLTLDMLRQGQRNVAVRSMADRVQLVAGRAERMPFADATFDALTFTYLLRYVDDPEATLVELARVVKPGGAVANLEFLLPESRFWRFWWWGYTRLLLPVGGWIAGGRRLVRGRPVPRPQHLGPLPALPAGVDGGGVGTGRLRGRWRPPDEPGRRPGDVGTSRRWVTKQPGRGRRCRHARPSTPPGPGGWRDWWTLLHPPYTAWHLSYVVIGACLAPVVDTTRLLATLLAFFCAVGLAAHALDELHGRPLRTQIPSAALGVVTVAGLVGAVALGVAGVVQVGAALVPFLVVGPLLVIAYNFELFGGAIHNDVGFAASWGAFPVLTAYVAQTGRLAVAPILAALGTFALSAAQRGPQHTGPDAAAADVGHLGDHHLVRRDRSPRRPRQHPGSAGAGPPLPVVGHGAHRRGAGRGPPGLTDPRRYRHPPGPANRPAGSSPDRARRSAAVTPGARWRTPSTPGPLRRARWAGGCRPSPGPDVGGASIPRPTRRWPP